MEAARKAAAAERAKDLKFDQEEAEKLEKETKEDEDKKKE